MWDEWKQVFGGGAVAGFGWLAYKVLWPLVAKRAEADGARATVDLSTYELITKLTQQIQTMQEALNAMHHKLNDANAEIHRLRAEIERLNNERDDGR